jgi:type VI protein secretion system component VasK
MIRSRTILAVILVAIGLVWVGQGTGLLKGTGFMVGDPKWAAIGVVAVIAGLALGWLEFRRRRQA